MATNCCRPSFLLHVFRDYDREFPGARGFGLIRRVAKADEARFVKAAQADGWPSFRVKQLAPHEGERFLIQFVSPMALNANDIGLDIASDPDLRAAAGSSMRTGKATLTGSTSLANTSKASNQAFLLLLPVYRAGMPLTNKTDRELACIGWTYAPLVLGEVVSGMGLGGGAVAQAPGPGYPAAGPSLRVCEPRRHPPRGCAPCGQLLGVRSPMAG
ncbi:MAG: CHASE domain-containing protein [Burkholderiaceae bacterium]